MKVEQFKNKNQFHLYGEEEGHIVDYLQSYNSTVVKITYEEYSPQITLGEDWDYSTTTSKHVYLFLEEYADIDFYGITNKRNYVKKLIESGAIKFDSEMK